MGWGFGCGGDTADDLGTVLNRGVCVGGGSTAGEALVDDAG